MRSFARGHLDLIVSTTVIEVGVDVPQATVMVIEDADRFGLSNFISFAGGWEGAEPELLRSIEQSNHQGRCRKTQGYVCHHRRF